MKIKDTSVFTIVFIYGKTLKVYSGHIEDIQETISSYKLKDSEYSLIKGTIIKNTKEKLHILDSSHLAITSLLGGHNLLDVGKPAIKPASYRSV